MSKTEEKQSLLSGKETAAFNKLYEAVNYGVKNGAYNNIEYAAEVFQSLKVINELLQRIKKSEQ